MDDRSTLSKQALLDLLQQQEVDLAVKAEEVANRNKEIADRNKEIADRNKEIADRNKEIADRNREIAEQDKKIADRDKKLAAKDDVIRQLEDKTVELELAYKKLWEERFHARSERYIDDPNQLRLDFGDSDEAADAAEGLATAVEEADLIPEHRRRKPRKKRDEGLPSHLERYEVTAEASADEKTCEEHGEKTLLPESMWDRIETLEFTPPKLKVRVTKYPKYACSNSPECGISSAERPTGIVEGNKYDAGVAAEIINGKFGYHLPVYRQQDWFAGSGWAPCRSTLQNILKNCHFIIAPLLEYFRQQVLHDSVVGCDDTGVTLLYPKELPDFNLDDPKERRIHEVFSEALKENKPSIRAKMWAYRGCSIKLNVFDFRVSRHRDGPEAFFANYSGTLLGDCYAGFESIVVQSDGAMMRAACNAHARRKIKEVKAYPADCRQWLLWYQQLYDIETRGKVLSSEQLLELRQTEAKPIWESIETWLEESQSRTSNVILPKSDFAKALQYIRNHFKELTRYLDDPLVPMDNNETELLMRQVALGRKNWLFCGSVSGGERNAGFMTLVSSAIRNDLDVWCYIKDVLNQLLDGQTNYEPLLPWNWAETHPKAIRQYRIDERKERTKRKREKRSDRRRQKRS